MNHWLRRSAWLLTGSLLLSPMTFANEYNVSFKGTDIQEFITTVGRNLHKTIIVDPAVHGKIDVKSYDALNEKQYYSFFLNVLQVYGFAAIEMKDGVIKVVKAKDAKTAAIPVLGDEDGVPAPAGDSVITRVVAVHNVSVKELSPILRQLVDNAGSGNVVHYDPANIILLTGTQSVVERLAEIIHRVDQVGDTDVDVVELKNASASEIVRIITALNKSKDEKNVPDSLKPTLVADERTNSVLVSGEPKVRQRIHHLINELDVEMATQGNTRVVYLKYAKAANLVDVLKGVAQNLQNQTKNASGSTGSSGVQTVSSGGKGAPGGGGKSSGGAGGSNAGVVTASAGNVMIAAHEPTNSLILTAPPSIMKSMMSVISQLDIRRAQVLIEALIVEMTQGEGESLGVQWGSIESGSAIQFSNTGTSISSVMVGEEEAKDQTSTSYYYNTTTGVKTPYTTTESGDYSDLADALSGVEGAAVSIAMGDWTALLSAVSTDSNSNILSSPSITVMDNSEASFIVGEEVPVLTGSTSSSDNSNPFQTVDRKEVGIKLDVVPQINEGDSVQLTIKQEVSNVAAADGAVDVRFAKRQLNTTVMVKDGQMLVLGGLMDERTQESESKVPLLGDIPLLGALFRSTSSKLEKRNLMVFIKPTIIRNGMTADGVTQRKYNYIRAEQLYNAQKTMKLMNDQHTPVLPKYGQDFEHPSEIQAFLDQIDTKGTNE